MDERKLHPQEDEGADAAETPAADLPADDTQPVPADLPEDLADEDVNAEDEDEGDPFQRKFAGMTHLRFYGILFGYGIGMVLTGVVGFLGLTLESSLPLGIACGAAGYFIAGRVEVKRNARLEAEKNQQN